MLTSSLLVEKWAQNKNPVMAFFAINHALIARMKSEALQYIKARRVYNYQFPLPDLQLWFTMYTSRKPIYAYKRLIVGSSDLADKEIGVFLVLRHFNKFLKKRPDFKKEVKHTADEIKKSLELWQGILAELFDEIRDDIAQNPLTDEMQAHLEITMLKDELPLAFYLLVYAPCYVFYQTSPSTLYRKALSGDVPAIENLIKLDPLIIHDPALGFQIQSVRLHGKTNDYELIVDAITKQPGINYKKITDERRSIKSDHGGQILCMFSCFRYSLKASEVRELFDSLAFDYDGNLIDTDIKKPAGFDKAVQKKATAWKKQIEMQEKLK